MSLLLNQRFGASIPSELEMSPRISCVSSRRGPFPCIPKPSKTYPWGIAPGIPFWKCTRSNFPSGEYFQSRIFTGPRIGGISGRWGIGGGTGPGTGRWNPRNPGGPNVCLSRAIFFTFVLFIFFNPVHPGLVRVLNFVFLSR